MTSAADHLGEGDLFRSAMRNSAVGMALVAPDGTLLSVNPAFSTMLGRSEDELAGCTWQQVTHPDDVPVDASLVDEVLRGERESYRLLKRYQRPDGQLVWGDLSVSCLRDGAGAVTHLIAQILDVTAEVELRERYRLLVENSTDCVAQADNEGRLQWVSDSVAHLLGWEPAQMVGQKITAFLHDDDQGHVAVAELSLLAGHDVRLAVRMRKADATFERVHIRLAPLIDVEGQVTGRVAAWRSVEAEFHARAELELSESRFRMMAENSSDVVMHTGSDGTLQWVSPSVSAVLGWEPAQLVGRRYTSLIHPDDLGPAVVAMRAALGAGRTSDRVEARVATADGGWRWMGDRGHAIRDDAGSVIGGIDALRDIEVEVQAREALLASEEHFRLMAENASDVVYRINSAGAVTWISPNVADSLGWSPEELLGRSMYELIDPEDRPTINGARSKVLNGEDVDFTGGGLTVRIRSKSGSQVWMAVKAATFTDDNGVMTSAVVGMQNVDELVRQRVRAESDEMVIRATMDSILDPLVVVEAIRDEIGRVRDFVYVDANEAAADFLGRSGTSAVGSRMLDTMPGLAETGLLEHYVRALDHGAPLVLDAYGYWIDRLNEVRYYDIRGRRVTSERLSLTWRDVSDKRATALLIEQSEQRFRLLAENSSDVVVQTREGIIEWVSPSIARMLGWSPDEWIGERFDNFTHADDIELAQKRRAQVTAGATMSTRLRVRDREGTFHWVETHAGPMPSVEGGPVGIIASFRTIDELMAYENELDRRARYDDLTGALKRDEVLYRLSELTENQRQPGNLSAVLYCDIDNFKSINDDHGHAAGDAVLLTLVDRIRSAIRATNILGRLGGDEFLVVLDGVHDQAEALELAEKVRMVADEPIAVGDDQVRVGLSIGVTLRQPSDDVDMLVARADGAMYEAKNSGRNQVQASF